MLNDGNIWSVERGNFWYHHLHFNWLNEKTAAIRIYLFPAWLKVHAYDLILKAASFQGTTMSTLLGWRH